MKDKQEIKRKKTVAAGSSIHTIQAGSVSVIMNALRLKGVKL